MGILDAPSVSRVAPGADVLSTKVATALQPWYAALAQRDAAKAVVACVGTSVTEGGPVSVNGRGITATDRRWVNRLAANLRSLFPLTSQPVGSAGYIPTFYQSFNAGGTTTGGIGGTIVPTGVSYSSTALARAGFGFGNRSVELTSTSDWVQLTFTGTGCDVFVSSRTVTNSTATYSVDGGAAQTLTVSTATNTATVQQIRGLTAGSHTIRITGATGQVDVAGVYPYNGDEAKGIHVLDCGKGSAKASDVNGTGPYKSFASLTPSAIFFEFGYNEFLGNIDPAVFQSAFQTLITNALSFVTPAPTCVFIKWAEPKSTNPTYTYAQYMSVVDTLAAGTANSLVLDFSKRYPANSPDTYGYWHGDQVHDNNTGAGFKADVMTRVLSPR